MTVTKRKAINRDPNEERVPSQTGVSYACDVCSADISHTVRIRCAQVEDDRPTCEDFDLCGSCFVGGKEEPHAYPIFNNDWGADEELLLIDACQQYGLGNWMDIAEHIGSFRSKGEVEQHYYDTYLRSPVFPLPNIQQDLDPDQERFQQRKKARLEAAQAKPPAVPPPKPGPSVPVCHEVGGFMPARLEFEHEFDNEAEVLIKDMEFGLVARFGGSSQPKAQEEAPMKPEDAENAPEEIGDEDEEDLELKLAILDMYNERINKRIEIKSLIFDRNLVDYRKNQAIDKKRSKEEKDVIARNKPFARLQSRVDHEAYIDGLLYEATLRKRIAELQEYRRAGLVRFDEVERYEKDKQTHFAQAARGNGREWARLQKQALSRQGLTRAPTGTLSLATADSLGLLTSDEVQFCSREKMLPKPYLFIKTHLTRALASWTSEDEFGSTQVRAMFPDSADVAERVWAFMQGEIVQEASPVKLEEVETGMDLDSAQEQSFTAPPSTNGTPAPSESPLPLSTGTNGA